MTNPKYKKARPKKEKRGKKPLGAIAPEKKRKKRYNPAMVILDP